MSDAPLWSRSSWAARDVVGERSHLEAIRAIIGNAHRPDGADHQRDATLVAEPDNRFDPDAVAVHIEDHRVGYLSRDDAPRYRPILAQLMGHGLRPTVPARIWAAEYQDWDEGTDAPRGRFGAGVRLTLDEPHLLLPVNARPPEPFVLLPHGSPVQVHDTDEHLAQLAPLVGPMGEQWAYATLHRIEQQLPRSTRIVIEVWIDRGRVGRLTPKLSSDLLPAWIYLAEMGRTTAVRALVTGNRAAVSVKLYTVRAHQLDDRWFDEVAAAAVLA